METKYESIIVDQVVPDKYINDPTPLINREIKVMNVRRFVTQFTGNQDCNKVREEGVEHVWVTPTSTAYKTGNW